MTEIPALDFKSLLRIEVKRRVTLYFATSDEFLFYSLSGKAYIRFGGLYIYFCVLCFLLHAQNQSLNDLKWFFVAVDEVNYKNEGCGGKWRCTTCPQTSL